MDLENNGASGAEHVTKAKAGTAEFLIELEDRRSIKVTCRFLIKILTKTE
jgi:hypothetical protein